MIDPNDGPPIALAYAEQPPHPRDVILAVEGIAGTLDSVSTAISALAETMGASELHPGPEAEGCCADVDAAHDHGRELGWHAALAWMAEVLGGATP